MKLKLPVLLILLLFSLVFQSNLTKPLQAQTQLLSTTTWGGNQDEYLRAMALDTSGNVFLVGATKSFGAGDFDIFIVKLDASGNLLWQRTWGGPNADWGWGAATDTSGNLYVTGYTDGFATPVGYNTTVPQLVLLKFNSTGSLQWQKSWGSTLDAIPSAITLDKSGNIIVGTYGLKSAHLGAQGGDLIAKFSLTGSVIWSRLCNCSFWGSPQHLTTDNAGNIYASTNNAYVMKLDSTGNLVWATSWSNPPYTINLASSIAVDVNGSSYVVGGSQSSYLSNTSGSAFILKLNSTGGLVWQRTWGSSNDTAYDVTLDTQGHIYVTGETGRYDSGFLLKLSNDGNIQWQRTWHNGIGYAVVLTPSGRLAVGGDVLSAPPYALGFGSSHLGVPQGTQSKSTDTFVSYPITPTNIQGTVATPAGSTSYAGNGDVALFSFNNPSESIPKAPSLQAFANPNRITLNWTTPNNGGSPIIGYNIYRNIGPILRGNETLLASTGVQNIYTDTNVIGGIMYTYEVTALNALGESAYSNAANATTTTPPTPPGGLSAALNNSTIIVSWNTPGFNGGLPITGYAVYRGTTPGGETLYRTFRLDQLNITERIGYALVYSFTDKNVSTGNTYYYRVAAINSLGASQLSSEISVALPSPIPYLLLGTIVVALAIFAYVQLKSRRPSMASPKQA